MRKERKEIQLGHLLPNTGQVDWLPSNPREWTAQDVTRTARSIKEDPDFLEDRPLLVFPHGEDFVVFAGNLRREGCVSRRMKSAPCVVYYPETADDYNTIKRRAMKDNGSFGKFDYDALANEWDDLPLADYGIEVWDTDAQDAKPAPAQAQEDDFDETEDAVETRCKTGDIWELGNHRLMCGDSTDADCVEKLMNGEKADIAFTSPPYGVNDGGLRAHKEAGNNEIKPKNFYNEYNDTQDKWSGLMESSFATLSEHSGQQFINVQMLADNRRNLTAWAAAHADRLIDVLIWDKGHAAPQIQPNIVNNNFEFIFVFGGVDCSRKLIYGDFKGNTDAVLRIPTGQNEYAKEHGAVFPVALPAEILRINGKAQSVLDCFGGTGTTMIAAEQLGRKCYMMELDPHYCDIILARWEKLTGQTATKI